MVKSILAFEEVSQVGLAKPTLAGSTPEQSFSSSRHQFDDPSMLSGRLDDRNMMMKYIMHSEQLLVSTYAPPAF